MFTLKMPKNAVQSSRCHERHNIITSAEYEKYKSEPFTFVENVKEKRATIKYPESSTLSKKHPYYVDYVINELQKTYNITPSQIYKGGLQIYTTCNSKIQEAAEDAFTDSANFPASYDSTNIVQGAMTVLDPQPGGIVAMVGGREYTPMGLTELGSLPVNQAQQSNP
jgi:penicillin-binding protein 1A